MINSKVMKLVINGIEKDVAAANIAALIDGLAAKGDRVAVELNGDIVPRAKWPESPLKDGDKLEIVHFVGGG
jgi:thiamine biosynthesis protein ThiS